jgi:hypothetical protein
MGNILSSYKKGVIEDIVNSISGNTARYYAFAANPVASSNGVAAVCKDDYSNIFGNNWYLLFGKRLANTDIAPVIRKIEWTANTVYTRYDNMANNLANSSYYVAVTPAIPGELYHIYKCIDNANGANSTVAPDLQQASSFTKSDGYTWRYIYSISSANYSKFAVSDYMPVFANNTIVTNAKNYQGVEVVPVVNAGNGYISYHDGTIRTVVNSTLIEISANASTDNGFYVNNGIYIYNNLVATKQHAQQILKFYEKIVNKQANISRLIIHCEAGVSRSPAVALALSLIHDLKPSAYRLYRDHCCYNPYVFNMILNQWHTEDMERCIKTAFKF